MLRKSHADILRWSLLGALGASLTFACGGTAEGDSNSGDGDGDGATAGDGDGDSGGDGDLRGDGDGDGTSGDGDGSTGGTSGDGDGVPECTNPVDLGGGFYTCDEGYTGRGDPSECPNAAPRAEPIGDPEICSAEMGCCEYDADCTEPNQYCQYSEGQVIGAWCTSGCLTDSDCSDGQICQCGDPMGQCVAADCTSDDDCPGDARCASFATDEGCGPWTQFTCQTVDDECASNADCGDGMECDGTGGVRQCVVQEFLCAAGRPFVVGDEIRMAPLCERLDWAEKQSPSFAGLSNADRDAVASAWEEAAQMEHASIAAFARFSMQLLSLGAPGELIEMTNEALKDETRHARLCFGLASAYRGRPVGPQALDIGAAMNDHSLEGIVAMTMIEGCVGETVAALEAAEAAAGCEDPHVKAILEGIAADESRHAELAWRFVRWVMNEHSELRPFIESQFGHLFAEVGQAAPSAPLGAHERWGVLTEERRKSIRHAALRDVVQPCAQQLLRPRHRVSARSSEMRA